MYVNKTEYTIEEVNESIFEDLLKQYHQPVYIYCYNILRNSHDAEDAVQDVFMKAFQSRRMIEINNHSAWLYKIAYNHCINKIRRKALIEFIPFTEKNRLENEMDQELHSDDEIHYILSKLNPKERAISVLRIIEERDFMEIGEILSISAQTARKRYERVKGKIQKILERRLQDEG